MAFEQQRQIARVPSTISLTEFRREFYDPERPVIVEGTAVPESEELTAECISERFGEADGKTGAFASASLHGDPAYPMPPLVRALLDDVRPMLRQRPMRVWLHPRGHVSLYHFDANSLHVFSHLARGHKRWLIVSPDTPLPTAPFSIFSTAPHEFVPNPSSYDFLEFETKPGDLLFLPRYWFHRVVSLADINVNFNWVWTPQEPSSSVLGKRECELLKARLLWPQLEGRAFVFASTLEDYGGGGRDLAAHYCRSVTPMRAALRVLRELSSIPRALRARDSMRRNLYEFANGFGIPRVGAGRRESLS